MNFDVNTLKKIKNKAIKYSIISYTTLSSILMYKVYNRFFSEIIWENVSFRFKVLFYEIMGFLEALDGWIVFWTLVSIFGITLIICRLVERKIMEQGGDLTDDDETTSDC